MVITCCSNIFVFQINNNCNRDATLIILLLIIITFTNSPVVVYMITCNMDLQGWEFLWKILATIGVANILLFFIIVFVLAIGNSIIIWILIAIESACYCIGWTYTFSAVEKFND